MDNNGFGDMGMNPYNNYGDSGYFDPSYKGPKENYFFSLDQNQLLFLGFSPAEISVLQEAVNYYGIVSVQKLSTPPFMINDYTTIQRIMYAYNICMGKSSIEMTDPLSLSKHYKKLSRMVRHVSNFSCLNLLDRRIQVIPRVAVVAGMPKGSFFCLNSKLYDKMEASYRVEGIAQEWVTILSERKMAVRSEDRLNDSYKDRQWGIEGILKVESVGSFAENKPWRIKIHKSHCRLCNRFMIIATTTKVSPEAIEHHGGYILVLDDGTVIYLYAKTTDFDAYGNPKDTVYSPSNNRVVLDYGFYRGEIKYKLDKAASEIAKKFRVMFSSVMENASHYTEISPYNGMTAIRRLEPDEVDEYANVEILNTADSESSSDAGAFDDL